MKPGTLKLSATANVTFLGSDGRLEIDVPTGAVTASDIAAAGGAISLQVTEIAPPSGSNAGGADSLGSYEIITVNGQGAALSQFARGLRKPWTLKLHYSSKDSALDLAHVFLTVNGAHPKTIGQTAQSSSNAKTPGPQAVTGLGPYSSQATTLDATNHVLQAQISANPAFTAATPGTVPAVAAQTLADVTANAQSTPPTTYTYNTYAPVAKFGSPSPSSTDLNSGSLTEGIQLDVPPGPAGAMPNITLAYNSGAVSEQHSPQGAAGWVGEGWSLSLGEISWSEHNVVPTCSSNCSNSWQDEWVLTDPFGTSTELIPPNLATSTYYDDTNNWWCTTGNAAADACPIQFHTANESYAKVYAYVGPNKEGASPDPMACFRVYLTNGVMEEFGCTADSIQYYPLLAGSQPGQTQQNVYYPVNYLLDMITNAQGDQVHITYQSDMEAASDGLTYPRDTVPATIEWDSPSCVNATQRCTGSSWAPHYRVQFVASHHTVSRLTNSPSGCNTDTSVRCDDPANVSGGVNAPLINGTFVLNDANVQVNNGGTWNTVYDYQFSYEQSGPTTQTDPVTGKSISYAGYLDLTQLTEVGDDGSTAYPPTTFGYTSQDEYYEDGSYTPYSTTACGPSWNTGGNGGGCDLWSQTYAGNDRYLSTVSNGQGMQESISWKLARNNTHGVNSGQPADIANPVYCDDPTNQASYPCNSADDQAWSRVVVDQQSFTVDQITKAGQDGTQTTIPVTSTTAYTYELPYPLVAQECRDCVAGMYWGNQNDGDYLDYYNGVFMGFAQTAVSNPDGSIVVHTFESTMGWGVYDTSLVTSCPSTLPPLSTTCHASPWWNVANAGHGQETEVDYYDTDGTTLLKKVTNSYNAVCPPSGVSATPQYNDGGTLFGPWDGKLVSELDHNNPVADCDVQLSQQVTSTYDGTGNAVTETDSYTYDAYGQVTVTHHNTANGAGSPTDIYDKTTYISNNGLTLPASQRSTTNQESAWGGVYLIDLPALQTVENSSGSGNRYSCNYTDYDGTAYTTGQASGLTDGNVTEQDTYSGCGTSPSYTPSGKIGATTSYDSYGNVISSKDPDANSGDSSHTIATGSCALKTTCTSYNATSEAQANQSVSVNNLTSTSNDGTATGPGAGYGLWPTSTTDANGQTTTYTYDALGRQLTTRAPGQTTGPPTQATVYTNWCDATGPSIPCVEVDTTTRTDSSDSVTTRQFYDGEKETRTPAPNGQDVVQYTLYNAAGQAATASVSYFVTAYTGAPGADAFSYPDSSQAVTMNTYDGLGRLTQTSDPLSNTSQVSYAVVCNAPGTSDATCYEESLGVDANGHQVGGLSDGLGRGVYAQQYSGNSPATYAVYSTTKTVYDYNGNVVESVQPNGTSATVSSFDAAGRLTSVADPDSGLTSYLYDSNGNQTEQIDARCGTTLPQTACSAGTTYTGYDGLNRPSWVNDGSDTPGGANVTYSYDGTPFSNGAGRLTAEVFRSSSGTSATSFSGAYTYSYDAQGRTIQTDQTMGGAGACPTSWTCQDIGSPGVTGGQSYAGDSVWTVQGGGADIWGTSDQFHYVSQSLSGDGTLSAHVESQTNTNAWAKAGIMVRASSAANAAFYDVLVTPSENISVQYRDATGGSAAILTTITGAAPAYIEVIRSGTTYSVETSSDGTTWAPVTASSRSMPNLSGSVMEGLAITSHDSGALATATFDQITTTPTVPSGVTVTTPAAPSGVTSYPIQTAYNDAGMPTQTTYSDDETLGYSYDSASAWLTGLTATPQGGTATQLLSDVSYSGAGGAAGQITGASVGGGLYTYAASDDADTRLTALSVTRSSDSTLLYSSQRGYDAVGNVTDVLTTLPDGTDSQAFCYDEQNRLVWASSASGSGPCGASNTAGSLTSASYTESDSYDSLGRLTSGPLGAYTYGDAAHLHAVTAIGPSGAPTYTASYDAAGNMTCRAPTSATTCAGTPTGATLAFDTQGRLASWAGGTVTDSFLYDGAGNRVAQQVKVNGTNTTLTTYVDGGQEEIATTGRSSTLTKYFPGVGGFVTAELIGTTGPLDYLASDGQGSVSVALDSNGNVTFQQLYTPYGSVRYSSGASPTAFGYTGQRADAATGLDYYNARYYDPVAQQFVSADSVSDGLSRYGYVGGNPETATDPSGHLIMQGPGGGTPDSTIKPCSGSGICDPGTGFTVPIGLVVHDTNTHQQVQCGAGGEDPCEKSAAQYSNDQTSAYTNAKNEGTFFSKLALTLGIIGGILAGLGGAMAAFAISSGNAVLFYIAQILVGIGAALAALALPAGLIGTDFSAEATNAGNAAGMNQDVVWQAQAAVNQDLGVGGAGGFAAGGGAIATDVFLVLAATAKGASAVATASAAAAALSSTVVTGGLITGAAAYTIAYGAGIAFMLGKTGGDFGSQACEVNTYVVC